MDFGDFDFLLLLVLLFVMSNPSDAGGGVRFPERKQLAKRLEKSNFSQACNLLSQFLKEKRSLADLSSDMALRKKPRGIDLVIVWLEGINWFCFWFLLFLRILKPSEFLDLRRDNRIPISLNLLEIFPSLFWDTI